MILYPRISIITPSFNQGHFIEETILSVLNQNYPNLEYIIIDGGSTDNTIDTIKKYERQLTYWVSEKDNGQSHAINKGMLMVTGDIVNWLNSDDYYSPDIFKHIANKFEDKTVTAYCGKSVIFSTDSKVYSQGTDIYADNLAKTIGLARIDQPETFFRKSVWDKIGFLNEQCHYVMDRDFWIRYLNSYQLSGVVSDDKILANFRLHKDSKTVSVQKEFQTEGRDLYFTYAKNMGLNQYSDLMSDILKVKEVSLDYKFDHTEIDLWHKVFNYYLYQEGISAYAQNDYKLAKTILKNISKDFLSGTDIRILNSVITRIKFLPLSIKKVLNKIKCP